ncbi:M20/M25/M40 family metallo-hydrolase [Maribellus sediminis]|uniref:M20/M25/M40 family metallo-hydrolase n=1 Tax=Maribellus sediminis TaxID=2696285 RepID=UPI00143113CB|nr:M20/M25/M40 family metallo-hydrolase [Maribellus sediminis]
MIKTKLALNLMLLLAGSIVFAQNKPVETITESDLQAHLEYVASDLMQGRDFNTIVPGLELAANYIKTQCKKLGLKPGFDDYFQTVEMVSSKPDPENTYFQLIGENGEVAFEGKDFFSLGGASENDTVKGNIVFAGYGWYNNETKYNDTEGLDLKGKVVVVMTRNPEMVKADEKNNMQIEMQKMQKAVMGGAQAVLFISDPQNPDKEYINSIKKYATGGMMQLKGGQASQRMPIKLLFGTEELADQIVKESGKTLAQIQNEMSESGSPKSFDIKELTAKVLLGKAVSIIEGKNIVAMVEGSDPVLKNECVVYTAHYDHMGVDGEGGIYNGADDNGTGTVALLEIAEAFQSMKKKPKRSIVFAWVTAEEKGLIGSDYYSRNPVFAMEKTLADINLDMIGRSAEQEPDPDAEVEKSLAGPNGLYIVSGKQSSELMGISNDICKELGLIPSDKLSQAFLTRSDYYHFYKNGVPVLGLSTGLHDDYHTVNDELAKIDYHKMKRVAQYSFLVGEKVANQKQRIVVDNPAME